MVNLPFNGAVAQLCGHYLRLRVNSVGCDSQLSFLNELEIPRDLESVHGSVTCTPRVGLPCPSNIIMISTQFPIVPA